MTRVIVCGGRDFSDRAFAFSEMDQFHAGGPITCVIQGGASGADRFAREWATTRDIPSDTFVAQWRDGKRAGPMRNARMLADGKPDIVIAFPGGRGTADMVRKARAAGIPVIEVRAPSLGVQEDTE